jgi:hypothetical protein
VPPVPASARRADPREGWRPSAVRAHLCNSLA